MRYGNVSYIGKERRIQQKQLFRRTHIHIPAKSLVCEYLFRFRKELNTHINRQNTISKRKICVWESANIYIYMGKIGMCMRHAVYGCVCNVLISRICTYIQETYIHWYIYFQFPSTLKRHGRKRKNYHSHLWYRIEYNANNALHLYKIKK